MCPNHPNEKPYLKSVAPLCESCLAELGQAIIDAGTYECLSHWAETKNYDWHQAMVRLGMASLDADKFALLVNRADVAYCGD